MKIAAIDQGTTSTRVLTMDAQGRLHPLLSLPHGQSYPAPGHVEQDGEELLANIARCLDAAGADLIGLANQGESCLAWDGRDGRPVSPVISWQDDRTADVTAALEAQGHERFATLHAWMRERLAGDLTVPTLAARMGMSERSLLRHYRADMGTTPARTVERLRVEAARQRLSDGDLPVKAVARSCGFGSEETMRRSFLRLLGVGPQAYRERFRSSAPSA